MKRVARFIAASTSGFCASAPEDREDERHKAAHEHSSHRLNDMAILVVSIARARAPVPLPGAGASYGNGGQRKTPRHRVTGGAASGSFSSTLGLERADLLVEAVGNLL